MRLTSLAGPARLRLAFVVAASILVAGGTPLLAGVALAGPESPQVVDGPAAVLAAFDALPPTPDTAWGIDPVTGQLVLTVTDAAPAAGAARLLAFAGDFGDRVRIVRGGGPLTEQVLGGDSITDDRILCSVGFNVTRGGQYYLLTAGHCTAGLPRWTDIGPSVASDFPGTDYGVVRNDSGDAPGAVDLYTGSMQPITSVGTPTVGEKVCASGSATRITCGQVRAVDQTVDYGDGNIVHGLIQTDVHTDHGDSGGPLFDGAIGLGMVSGGDTVTDYFQPLAPILAADNLSLA